VLFIDLSRDHVALYRDNNILQRQLSFYATPRDERLALLDKGFANGILAWFAVLLGIALVRLIFTRSFSNLISIVLVVGLGLTSLFVLDPSLSKLRAFEKYSADEILAASTQLFFGHSLFFAVLVLLLYIQIASRGQESITKPLLIICLGFFLGVLWHDLRRDTAALLGDPTALHRQVEFYTIPTDPRLAQNEKYTFYVIVASVVGIVLFSFARVIFSFSVASILVLLLQGGTLFANSTLDQARIDVALPGLPPGERLAVSRSILASHFLMSVVSLLSFVVLAISSSAPRVESDKSKSGKVKTH